MHGAVQPPRVTEAVPAAAPPRDGRDTSQPLLALAARSNVHVKFSGLYAVSVPDHDFPHDAAKPFVDVALEAFGPSRLLWGSDFPPALDFVSFPQAADARLLRLHARRDRGRDGGQPAATSRMRRRDQRPEAGPVEPRSISTGAGDRIDDILDVLAVDQPNERLDRGFGHLGQRHSDG